MLTFYFNDSFMPVISGDGLMIISLLSNSCTLIGVSFPLIFSNFTPLTRTWCIYFIYIWNRRADVSIQKCQIKQTQLIIKVFFISAHILIKCLRIWSHFFAWRRKRVIWLFLRLYTEYWIKYLCPVENIRLQLRQIVDS